MKTLLQTTLWVPNDAELRMVTVKRHLDYMLNYKGEWDLHIVNNSEFLVNMFCEFIDKFTKIFPNKKVILDYYPENKGWCFARNRSITRFMENNDYDNLMLIDCDVWCENNNWIINCQKVNEILPAFMIRSDEPQNRDSKPSLIKDILLWRYNEWIGNINILNREIINVVGGYDNITFPEKWGLHDCEYGRRLAKAGVFQQSGQYPSMGGAECCSEHDDEYQQTMTPIKNKIGVYLPLFGQAEAAIREGTKPLFFDYKC